jgi:hypothetical protein
VDPWCHLIGQVELFSSVTKLALIIYEAATKQSGISGLTEILLWSYDQTLLFAKRFFVWFNFTFRFAHLLFASPFVGCVAGRNPQNLGVPTLGTGTQQYFSERT